MFVIMFQSKEIVAQIEETKQEGKTVKDAIKKLMVRQQIFNSLNFYHSLGNFSRWHIWSYLSVLFSPENRLWHFMQIVSEGDNLHEVSMPIFWEKWKKKKISEYNQLKFFSPKNGLLHSMQIVKWAYKATSLWQLPMEKSQNWPL